jgi:beta-fructofuranosidase
MFWVRDIGGPEQGWAGAQSIPYLLAVDDHGVRLRAHPTVKAATPDEVGVVGLDWWPIEDAMEEAAVLDLPAVSGGSAVRLEARHDTVHVAVAGSTLTLRRGAGPVSVLADHQVLEICTGAAVAAFALPADATPPQQATPGSTVPWGRATTGAVLTQPRN